MDRGYKEAIIQNPKFVLRRIKRGIKTGEFFWDAYYFLKFVISPSTSSGDGACSYAYKIEWPTYDFANNDLKPLEVQKPPLRDWRKFKYVTLSSSLPKSLEPL